MNAEKAKGPAAISSKARCPSCGAHTLARIQYGLPLFSPKLERDLEAGRVVLGGCLLTGDDPDFACTTCGGQFRRDGSLVSQISW